jgi:hypothetical protein
MRKLIAVAAVLSVTSLHAAEELKFGDVNYFLKAGQFNLAAEASQTFNKQSPGGSPDYETRANLFESRFGYGVSDKLNVYVGIDYAYKNETEILPEPNVNSWINDGFSNPLIGANYRLMGQNEARYNFDLGAVARVNLQDSERGFSANESDTEGNFANGRNYLEVNARIGRKWNDANEWQLAAGFAHNFAGETDGMTINHPEIATRATTNATTGYDLDASTDFFLRAIYQYRPVNEFMIALTAEARRVGEFEYNGAGSDYTEDAHIDGNFEFRAKYLITETFIANFHYSISRLEQYDVESSTAGSQELKRRRAHNWGLGVDFLF